MSRKITLRMLALATGIFALACSDAGTPAEPTGGQTVQFSVASDSAHARHEQLKQQLEERKAYFKATKDANRENLRAARAEWKAWMENWKEQFKIEKEAWKRAHPGEKGGPVIELLRCEPRDFASDAAIIGPNGGSLHVGEHELVIPKGALQEEVLISAEAPTSSLVDVQFEPHGLEFQQPVQLKLSYKGCVRPTISDFLVAYLGQGNQLLELLPSHDMRLDGEVDADIEHFSRYAIAW
jgi:hypothetical protein